MRKLFVKIFVSFLAVASMSGFLSGLVIATTSTSAGAAPAQSAGDDSSAWQPQWSWTYNNTFVLDDPGTGFFNISESVKYIVQDIEPHTNWVCPASYDGGVCLSSTPGATAAGTYNTYRVTYSGAVTSATATADGENLSVNNGGSGVVGTEWVETSNLASVETDQTQTITGTVDSLETINISLQDNDVYTPAQVNEDFRLHNADQWLENTNVYDNGIVNYTGSGIDSLSGTAPIDSYAPINATATDTTVSGGDSINYNDAADQTSDTRVWSNSVHNITSDNFLTGLPQGTACTSTATASCENATQTLTSSSTPAPSAASTVSETINGTTNGLACGGQALTVTGALGSGGTGVPVTVAVDESTIVPGQSVKSVVNSTGGGAYTATITAPNTPDGLNKPSVNGSFGVTVSSGSSTNVQTLEVSPQDCTTISYNGATSGPVGSSAAVSATVVDIATNQPVAGAVVTFSLTGQSTTIAGVTNGSGVATGSLLLQDNPSTTPYVLSASYAGGPTDAASSTTSHFTVGLDPTSTSVTASETSATIGDTPTFTAHVTEPGATSGALTGTVTFSVNGSALGSPVTLTAGSATSAPLNTLSLGLGTYNVVATYSGNADYATSSGNIPAFDVHNPLTPTVTSLAVSPSNGSSVFGQTVTLTATVSPQVDNTNAAVTFFDGGTSLGTSNLSGTSPDTATITVSSLTVGSHSLTAQYAGDNNVTFAPSTSNPVAETVSLASSSTAVTLTTPAGTPVAFQPVTFGITVSPPTGETAVPTGTVQVAINGVNLGGPLTLTGGVATASDPAGLSAGSSTITASYSGDSGFSASNGSLAQTVNQAGTTTTLVSSTGTSGSVLNQAVTFTANVTPQEAGNPTGAVTFFGCATAGPCSTSLGQSTLAATGSAGSQATLQISSLPEGDNFISVSYGGDGNFIGSASTQFDQFVSPPPPTAPTTTTVSGATAPASSSPNTSVFGQAVTFTATISTAPNTAVAAPSGTVQFSVDGTNLGGPVTLSTGSGDFGDGFSATATSPAISALAAGGHSVIATYSGLTGAGIPQAYEGSGAVVTQEVQQAATTVSGSPSANPAAYGTTETFTATLQAVAPGAGTPGGSVQFSLNGAPFGAPATVNSGQATSGPAASLLPGTYTVTYVTTGDANFLSSSGSFTFVVQPIPTSTVLTATPNPVVFGQPVTLTATVSHATGPGTPTGTVTFTDGATVLSMQTLASSSGGSAQASFTTATLTAGTHSITASYSGSANFGVSSSNTVSLVVGSSATKVVAQAAIVRLSLASLLAPATIVSLGPLQATLTTTGGVPIPGQTLVFTAKASPGGPVVCSGVTNAQGLAQCAPTVAGSLQVDLTGGFTATYAATPSFGGSNGSAGLISIIL
ncbi:MAG TPA: Ig-like domain repeat protein [Acidimicrobiales bacterium]|nr:Ig-like domain repeat protein [Acidimicrobiales bacterium]